MRRWLMVGVLATSATSSGPTTGLTPTRYLEVRRRFLRDHPGHVLDSWPLLPSDL